MAILLSFMRIQKDCLDIIGSVFAMFLPVIRHCHCFQELSDFSFFLGIKWHGRSIELSHLLWEGWLIEFSGKIGFLCPPELPTSQCNFAYNPLVFDALLGNCFLAGPWVCLLRNEMAICIEWMVVDSGLWWLALYTYPHHLNDSIFSNFFRSMPLLCQSRSMESFHQHLYPTQQGFTTFQ